MERRRLAHREPGRRGGDEHAGHGLLRGPGCLPVSCRAAGCTIAGGLDTNDGQGDSAGTGTTFAWRGTGGHFAPQVTPNPAGTAGGELTSVSCTASGFCAAATSTGDGPDFVAKGDPSVLVRRSGRWTAPPNAGSGFLSSVSCTSASFCLALGSAAGAERWDGRQWSELSAPDPFDPAAGLRRAGRPQ